MVEDISLEIDDKPQTKGGRLSKLFQKKNKKKSFGSSTSSLSLTESNKNPPSINSQNSSHNLSEIQDRNSYLDSRIYFNDTASMNSKLTRNISIRSTQSITIQQTIQHQRQILKELEQQKEIFCTENIQLQDQLLRTQEKLQQRTRDLDQLQQNYQTHLRSIRSSNDDPTSIGQKLLDLRCRIGQLAAELLPHAEPDVTGPKLSTLWLNLTQSIQHLGPLDPIRIQMLTEKFIMDVVVQNLNINFFPGLSCNLEFLELQRWFEHHEAISFSTRLRQELSIIVVQNHSKASDIQDTWKSCAHRNWHHLFKGLQKAYPTYLAKKSTADQVIDPIRQTTANEFSKKLKGLVEYTMILGSAIKGQEVCITAVDVREGVQPIDTQLMNDDDGQVNGTIAFCISPPFVLKKSNRYEPLLKGRVLCFNTI